MTKASSDESDAIVSDYSLSESDSSSRDDKPAKVVCKSILAQENERKSNTKSNKWESNLRKAFSSVFAPYQTCWQRRLSVNFVVGGLYEKLFLR